MSLKDTFARGFVWKIAGLVALLVFGWLSGTGNAWAHTPASCGDSVNRTCDKGEALTASKDLQGNGWAHCTSVGLGAAGGYTVADGWAVVEIAHSGGTDDNMGQYSTSYAVRYTASGYQASCGPDNFYYGASCNARTDQDHNTPQLALEKCVAGCVFKAQDGYETRTNSNFSDGTTGTAYMATMQWTGATCPTGEVDPDWKEKNKPKEQECTPAGSGQSYCVKDNGDNCYTANSGRMTCWTPGETGQKTDGSTLQVKAAGNSPPPAPLAAPPAGQSWVQGPGATNITTVTVGGNTTITNTTNFTTSGGAVAGSTNQGETNTGQSGNGQCTVNCSQNNSTGGSGAGTDMGPTNALLTAIKTAVEKTREFFDGITGEASGLDQDQGETEDPAGAVTEETGSLDLDASGFGMAGGSCPAPPMYMGVSLDAGGYLCMFAQLIGALVLAAAYVQAAYIIGRA